MHFTNLKSKGGNLKIVNVSNTIMELFSMTGMSDYLDISRDKELKRAVPYLAEMPLPSTKNTRNIFLPTVLTAMATNIAMIVDSIIAGNLLGQNSLAAINLMSPISQLYFSITILFGLGASSIISFAKGRRDEKQANRVFTSTFIVLIALSVIFIAIQLPLADSISSLLTKDAELKSLLYQYYVPFIIGTPIYLLLMCSIHFVREQTQDLRLRQTL